VIFNLCYYADATVERASCQLTNMRPFTNPPVSDLMDDQAEWNAPRNAKTNRILERKPFSAMIMFKLVRNEHCIMNKTER
jgi:hypothetical protein